MCCVLMVVIAPKNSLTPLKGTTLFANTREISLERALLYTASHRQTEGEPVILRRAKATAYILEHVEISIRDEELIAGNRTVKPRAGIMSPETLIRRYDRQSVPATIFVIAAR